MISYCRNLEDVIIQRVFADVPEGRYLDIGASAPINDSTTYALYERGWRGWRGIAADPILQAQDWQAHRPRDLALRTMIGAQPGTQRLFAYPNFSQSSTGAPFIRDHLARWSWKSPSSLPTTSSPPIRRANPFTSSRSTWKAWRQRCCPASTCCATAPG